MSDKVVSTSAQYDKWSSIWKKCRAFAAGQDEVQDAGEDYLPRLDGQDDVAYNKYLKSGYLYNATGRTRQAFIGMIMRKDPDVTLPAALKTIREDIDQEGTSLEEFAKNLVEEELTVARGGILVDFPQVDTTGMSVAETERLNLRPYAVQYQAENILFSRREKIKNVSKLVHVRLYETEEVEGDEEFEVKIIERVRVLELVPTTAEGEETWEYRQRVFIFDEDKKQWLEDIDAAHTPKMNGRPLDEIPFIFVGGDKFRAPHILDLVNANLQHYIQTADHRAGLKWTTRPQAWATGVGEDELTDLTMGGYQLWKLKNPQGRFGMLEYSGAGLSAMEKTLEDLKTEMATLGARMIAPDKRATETAEVHSIKRQGENSALASVANNVSEALTRTMKWMARWMGVPDTNISIVLNTDFVPAEMSADDVIKWTHALHMGTILPQDYYHALSQGEVLDPSISIEERIAALQTRPGSYIPAEPAPTRENGQEEENN